MAGHLARNQVHAGSIPAALTDWVGAPGRAVGLQSRRTAFESLLTRNADRMASVTSLGMTPRPTTSSACWKAPPNGRQRVPKTRVVALSPRGSIPPPSSVGDDVHVGFAHSRAKRAGASPGSSTLPVSSARPSRQVGRRRAATSVRSGSTPLSVSICHASKVFVAARRLARSEERVRLSLDAHPHRCPSG